MTGALLALCVLLPAGVLAAIIAALVVRSRRQPALRWVEVRSVRLPASEVELLGEARHALDAEVERVPTTLPETGSQGYPGGGIGMSGTFTCPKTGRPCSTPRLCAAHGCPLTEE